MTSRLVFAWMFCCYSAAAGAQNGSATADSQLEAKASSPEAVEFFEAKVRPLLIEACIDCHDRGGDAEGGLVLSDRAGWTSGGDSGAAIVPGKPDESRLLAAVSYEDPYLQMPPDGKLSAEQIAILRQWVEMGAADPREGPASAGASRSTALPLERAQEHWAYRALGDEPIAAAAATRSDNPIDAALGLDGTADWSTADWQRLQRRLNIDLIGWGGIDPSVELSDVVSIERYVDRLLGDPRYGERMARRWMDLVRYADSITLRGFVLPTAYRYRYWLADSFNADLPYDEFLIAQIAGDQLAATNLQVDWQTRSDWIVACGFWLMGNTNLEEQDKPQLEMNVIDEQIDVFGKAILAQTVSCARCHDHKFDPIPTADYYALAGILTSMQPLRHANVSNWVEIPLPLPDAEHKYYQELEGNLAKVEGQLKDLAKQTAKLAKPTGPVAIKDLAGVVVDDAAALKVGDWKASTFHNRFVGDGYIHDQNAAEGSSSVTFAPANLPPGEYTIRLAYQGGGSRSKQVSVTVASADGEQAIVVDQSQPPPIDGLWVELGQFRFEPQGQAYVLVSNAGSEGFVIADAVQFLPAGSSERLAPSGEGELAELKAQEKQMKAEQAKLQAALSDRPHALGFDAGSFRDVPVHVRGSVHTLGAVAPRGMPRLVSTQMPHREPARTDGADRLQLAKWVTDPANPLTARVYVNRVWQMLMGRGLVESVDNFGTTGTPPSNLALLDHLTRDFIEHDWSTRWLVRTIATSQSYKQLHQSDSGLRVVPGEVMRDTLLAAAQSARHRPLSERELRGIKNDYNYKHDQHRLSFHLPVFRNSSEPFLTTFDAADPSSVVGRRNETIVAAQALVMLNSPWVQARIDEIVDRLAGPAGLNQSDAEAIGQLAYQLLGRDLSGAERDLLVGAVAGGEREAWRAAVAAIVGSIDFRMY